MNAAPTFKASDRVRCSLPALVGLDLTITSVIGRVLQGSSTVFWMARVSCNGADIIDLELHLDQLERVAVSRRDYAEQFMAWKNVA